MIDLSFYGYPYSNKKEWIERALKETGLKSIDELGRVDEVEGLKIFPIFTKEDFKGSSPFVGLAESSSNPWENISSFDIDLENPDDLQETLNLGIDGLVLEWSGDEGIQEKLAELEPQYLSLWLVPKKEEGLVVLKRFLNWAKNHPMENIKGGFLWDPLAQMLHQGVDNQDVFALIDEINDLTRDFPHFRGVCVDMGCYLESGANTTQQLAFGMGGLTEMIKFLYEKGEKVENIYRNLLVKVAVGGDYFLNISKLKLVRIFASQIAGLFNMDKVQEEICIFSQTALWTKSNKDKYSNLVRNTVESLMAVNGGSDIVFVSGSDLALSVPDIPSKRLAANIPNLLKWESNLNKMEDHCSGAYYLNFLMDQLFDKVRDKLIELEENGGWLSSLGTGDIQREIKNIRNKQLEALKDGSHLMVGVNAYGHKDDYIKSDVWENWQESSLQLKGIPKSILFDQLYPNFK